MGLFTKFIHMLIYTTIKEVSMLYRILIIMSVILINQSNSAQYDKRIHEIPLDGGFKLVPYQEGHKEALKSTINDPNVFTTIRHGEPWSDDLIQRRHDAYLKGNASENEKYDPATFLACWVLITPEGDTIGRGGFQVEDECNPIATEVFFAIKGDFQHQGLGKKSFIAIIRWFDETIGSHIPLRWLAMSTNEASKHLAGILKFKPRYTSTGQQLAITNWGKEYLVFERRGEQELKDINS
jgi:hypothetical protein